MPPPEPCPDPPRPRTVRAPRLAAGRAVGRHWRLTHNLARTTRRAGNVLLPRSFLARSAPLPIGGTSPVGILADPARQGDAP